MSTWPDSYISLSSSRMLSNMEKLNREKIAVECFDCELETEKTIVECIEL